MRTFDDDTPNGALLSDDVVFIHMSCSNTPAQSALSARGNHAIEEHVVSAARALEQRERIISLARALFLLRTPKYARCW